MSQYLDFVRRDLPGRATPVVIVRSKSSGATLGHIAWYGPWRQFCFWPEAATLFNGACMTDIQDQITALAAERKAQRA